MPGRKAFPLRISPELYAELRRWAEAEFRSVNGQIEFILREAVQEHKNRAGHRDRDGSSGPGRS